MLRFNHFVLSSSNILLYGISSIESFSDCLVLFRKAVAIDIWLVSTGLSKDADGLNKA